MVVLVRADASTSPQSRAASKEPTFLDKDEDSRYSHRDLSYECMDEEASLQVRLARLEQRVEYWGERLAHQLHETFSQKLSPMVVANQNHTPASSLTMPPVAEDPSQHTLSAPRVVAGSTTANANSTSTKCGITGVIAQGYQRRTELHASTASPQKSVYRGSVISSIEAVTNIIPRPKARRRGPAGATRNLRGMHKEELRYRYNSLVGSSLVRIDRQPNLAEQIVRHNVFDYIIGFAVAFNAIAIGAEVQHEAVTRDEADFFLYAEVACIAIFTIEIILRLMAYGTMFCVRIGRLWAALDVFLLCLAYVDLSFTIFDSDSGFTTTSAKPNAGKVIKVVRMIRIMRVVRMVRFLGQLRVMFQMVLSSLVSLFWLIVLLLLVLYVFAVVLTKGVTDYTSTATLPSTDENGIVFQEYYGSLFKTMYTLFRSMTGGVDWGQVATPLLSISAIYFSMVILFICFTVFSVLNIITGVFVDGAMELAKRDRHVLVEKENQAREAGAEHLLELFEQLDTDGLGTITKSQFLAAMQTHEVVCFVEALQVDTSEVNDLFELLDVDSDGVVDVAEWVDGMRRLGGWARSTDVQRLRREVQAVARSLATFLRHLQLPGGHCSPHLMAAAALAGSCQNTLSPLGVSQNLVGTSINTVNTHNAEPLNSEGGSRNDPDGSELLDSYVGSHHAGDQVLASDGGISKL